MTYRSMGCALGVLVFWLLQAGSIAYSAPLRSEEHTSELQSQSNLVCRLLLEKKNNVLEALLIFLEHVRVPIEQPDRPHQEIVEVERMVLLAKRVVRQSSAIRELRVVLYVCPS